MTRRESCSSAPQPAFIGTAHPKTTLELVVDADPPFPRPQCGWMAVVNDIDGPATPFIPKTPTPSKTALCVLGMRSDPVVEVGRGPANMSKPIGSAHTHGRSTNLLRPTPLTTMHDTEDDDLSLCINVIENDERCVRNSNSHSRLAVSQDAGRPKGLILWEDGAGDRYQLRALLHSRTCRRIAQLGQNQSLTDIAFAHLAIIPAIAVPVRSMARAVGTLQATASPAFSTVHQLQPVQPAIRVVEIG